MGSEDEILRLREKVTLLEKALSSIEGGEVKCSRCEDYRVAQKKLKADHVKGN